MTGKSILLGVDLWGKAGRTGLPQSRVMAAAMWSARGRSSVGVLGTVSRSASSHAVPKPQYDALVIGGGERGQ